MPGLPVRPRQVRVRDLRVREMPFMRADTPLYDAMKARGAAGWGLPPLQAAACRSQRPAAAAAAGRSKPKGSPDKMPSWPPQIFRLGRSHMACLTRVTTKVEKELVAAAAGLAPPSATPRRWFGLRSKQDPADGTANGDAPAAEAGSSRRGVPSRFFRPSPSAAAPDAEVEEVIGIITSECPSLCVCERAGMGGWVGVGLLCGPCACAENLVHTPPYLHPSCSGSVSPLLHVARTLPAVEDVLEELLGIEIVRLLV